MAFQRYVMEVASGASPHCSGALKLAFGNTVNVIKQEHQKIEDERRAREEAEKQAAIEAARREELMSRPVLECRTTWQSGQADYWDQYQRNQYQRTGCGEVLVQNVGNVCACGRALVCSKCSWTWSGGNVCESCGGTFRTENLPPPIA